MKSSQQNKFEIKSLTETLESDSLREDLLLGFEFLIIKILVTNYVIM